MAYVGHGFIEACEQIKFHEICRRVVAKSDTV